MRNEANIELIGYVYGDPEYPMPEKYPNWIKFSLSVTRKWKNKQGDEQKEVSWYKCHSWSEGMSKLIKNKVKGGAGLLVKGFPKANAYSGSDGALKAQIDVNVKEFNIFKYPDSDDIQKKNFDASMNENADNQMLHDEIPF